MMVREFALALTLTLGQVRDAALPPPFQAARFRQHVAYLASDELEGRRPGTEGWKKAGDYVAKRFAESGLSPRGDQGTFFQACNRGKRPGRNVVALFPGAGSLAEQAVVVSAHYDHLGTDPKRLAAGEDGIFNGANDNASGVSAVLLLAEAMKRDAAELPASRRAVVFIGFDGEEFGFYGSDFYCEHPACPLKRTTAVINFDMMGRPRDRKVYAGNSQSSPVLEQRLQVLGGKCGLDVETRLSGAFADDYEFVTRGVPAFTFTTGLYDDYHRVTDEVQKIDAEGGARVAWLAYRVLVETIADPQPIAFRQPGPAYDVETLVRVMGRLGILPAVYEPGRYAKILVVFKGSSAAKAGIRGGDQITAFGGMTYQRVEDIPILFSRLWLDEGLRLSILRDGKQVEATLPAELFEGLFGPRAKLLRDDLYEVTFTYRRIEAKTVYLAGTFNDWKPTAHKMDGPDKEGRFTARMELKRGTYEYKFVLDGKGWVADPENVLRTGANQNSLLFVGVKP